MKAESVETKEMKRSPDIVAYLWELLLRWTYAVN
jgi:hypothetical protein